VINTLFEDYTYVSQTDHFEARCNGMKVRARQGMRYRVIYLKISGKKVWSVPQPRKLPIQTLNAGTWEKTIHRPTQWDREQWMKGMSPTATLPKATLRNIGQRAVIHNDTNVQYMADGWGSVAPKAAEVFECVLFRGKCEWVRVTGAASAKKHLRGLAKTTSFTDTGRFSASDAMKRGAEVHEAIEGYFKEAMAWQKVFEFGWTQNLLHQLCLRCYRAVLQEPSAVVCPACRPLRAEVVANRDIADLKAMGLYEDPYSVHLIDGDEGSEPEPERGDDEDFKVKPPEPDHYAITRAMEDPNKSAVADAPGVTPKLVIYCPSDEDI
jgi:hypothetical protein